jgi:hypothetical protein
MNVLKTSPLRARGRIRLDHNISIDGFHDIVYFCIVSAASGFVSYNLRAYRENNSKSKNSGTLSTVHYCPHNELNKLECFSLVGLSNFVSCNNLTHWAHS